MADAAERSGWLRYGAVMASILLALGIRVALDPILQGRQPFVVFYAAVAFSAWFGGLWPGLLALFVGLIIRNVVFLELPRSDDIVPALTYAGVSLLLVFFTHSMHIANRRTRQQARALHLSEARLSTVLDLLGEGVVVGTAKGDLIYWNNAALRMHGYASLEECRKYLDDFSKTFELWTVDGGRQIPIDEWPMRRILRGENLQYYELRLRRPDQNWEKIVSYSGKMTETASGERMAFLSIYDLTDQRAAQTALRESEKRYRTLFNSMDEGFCITEVLFDQNQKAVDYVFVETNAAFERQTGIQNAKGRRMREIAPQHEEHWFRIYGEIALTGKSKRFENEAAALGRWYDVYAFRTGAPEDRRVGIVFNDITDRKRMEKALRASEGKYRMLNQELEQRVTDRTRELTEANERLKEVDRLKSEFLATMSHELRTPLNSIIGFTEIIAAGLVGPVNDEQKRQLGMALSSAKHLLNLINDLLDLARIESGRTELVRENFDLRSVVDQVLETLRPLAAQKGLGIEAEVSGDTSLFTDRKMVFQILLNLANNAVKFTEQGTIRILAQKNNGTLRFDVSDTGIGIKPENMKLLFEAFRQVDGSARRRFEGTGLGLHLSKRLVELLGGQITVQSMFGKGSTFTVVLPVSGVQK